MEHNTVAIILNVENSQSSYYKYLKVYKGCIDGKIEDVLCTEPLDILYADRKLDQCDDSDRKMAVSLIENAYNEKRTFRWVSNQRKFSVDRIILHFRVRMDSTDDVTSLQYFFLIKQYINAKRESGELRVPLSCNMLIEADDESVIFAVSHFALLEIKKGISVFRKDKTLNGNIVNLPGAAEKTKYELSLLGRVYPLLEINYGEYKELSKTVSDVCREEYSALGHIPVLPRFNYMDSKISHRQILLDMCKKFFVNVGNEREKKQRDMFFHSEDFLRQTGSMSLLSFFVMCSYEFYSGTKEQKKIVRAIDLTEENLQKKISTFNNIASGLLQILENIVAHAECHCGYFSFRVRSSESKYLQKHYNVYLQKASKNVSSMTYLEINVSDFCLANMEQDYASAISARFMGNLLKRIDQGEEEIKEFFNGFHGIAVRDFFMLDQTSGKYGEIWRKYYSRQKNWMHHYGLKLYARIINMAGGFFEVSSRQNLLCEKEDQYYSTTDLHHDISARLPGTQYNIVLPYRDAPVVQNCIGQDSDASSDYMLQELLQSKIVSKTVNIEERMKGQIDRKVDVEKGKSFKGLQMLKEEYISKVMEQVKIIYKEMCEPEYWGKENNTEIFPVLILDLSGIRSSFWQEIVAKALWSYICMDESEKCFFCALSHANFEFIQYLANTISVYFGLNPDKTIVKDFQLYVCSTNSSEDFLISGSNLSEIRSYAYKFAASRGIFPSVLTYLFPGLGDFPDSIGQPKDEKKILPFDILIKEGNETRFEMLVKQVMERNIFHLDYGCKLPDTHIRLGSKIHIHNFFEAEILFQDCYFSKRMAYLVAKDIISKLLEGRKRNRVIKLVGYERYSEMFIYDIQKFLQDYFVVSSGGLKISLLKYAMCLDNNGTLKVDGLEDYKNNTEFIIIVSLNSTFTTHSKIKTILERRLGHSINKCVLANYGVILFRDDKNKYKDNRDKTGNEIICLEETFWKQKSEEKKIIKSNFVDKEIRYFVSKIADWEDPRLCRMCFPEEDLMEERALINTNKTSIIPSLQYGLIQNVVPHWISDGDLSEYKRELMENNRRQNVGRWIREDTSNKAKLKVLSEVVRYGHIKRADNHFLYYFDTKKAFDMSISDISSWLRNTVYNEIETSKKQNNNLFGIYNIIVTPVHESNTGFIQLINDCVFNNTAYIMRFEINRTYRANMMARYSNLSLLYKRLIETARQIGGQAQINIYFADDTIVSGRTYERAYSLVTGLYRAVKEQYGSDSEKVDVKIFRACFFLLNRLSEASQKGIFGEDCADYYYFDVPISSIRNHDDFCFMCNLIKDAELLRVRSSTNCLAQKWKAVENRFQLQEYYADKSQTKKELISKDRKMRYQNRFYSAYWSSLELKRMGELAEDAECVCSMIVNRLLAKKMRIKPMDKKKTDNERLEILFSYVKVLSRPFSNYQWRTRESILYLILLFLEVLLDETIIDRKGIQGRLEANKFKYIGDKDNLIAICEIIMRKRDIRNIRSIEDLSMSFSTLAIFVKQAMELNSNYIIRKKNIIRIMGLYLNIRQKLDELKDSGFNQSDESRWLDAIQDIRDFESIYIRYIKQLICLSGDEVKSVWLEELLLTGNEPSKEEKKADEGFISEYGIGSELGCKLYIENTRLLQDSLDRIIEELKYEVVHEKKITDDIVVGTDKTSADIKEGVRIILNDDSKYYMKSFQNMLDLNHIVLFEENGVKNDDIFIPIERVIQLNQLLEDPHSDQEIETFYQDIMVQMMDILNSKRSQCIVGVEQDNICVLLEVARNDANYIQREGGCIALFHVNEFANVKLYLETFGFLSKEGKEYLVIRLTSDTDGEGRKWSEDGALRPYFTIRPLFFLFDITGKNHIETIKRLRFILAQRASIMGKVEQDFQNNSFQKLIEEKNERMLLSVWKNARHSGDWIYADVMSAIEKRRKADDILSSASCEQKDYILKLEGIALRLLADSNISQEYHSSIKPSQNSKYGKSNGKIQWARLEELEKTVLFYCKDSIKRMPQKKPDDIVCEGIDMSGLAGRWIYHHAGQKEQILLVLIALIQNALMYCKENAYVKLYAESGVQLAAYMEENQVLLENKLDYLCITNPMVDPDDDIIRRMQDSIMYPVGKRAVGEQNSEGGISLYAANQYVEELIRAIYDKPLSFKEPVLKVALDNKTVIVKLPVLSNWRIGD